MPRRSLLRFQNALLALVGLWLSISLTGAAQAAGIRVTTPWDLYGFHALGEVYGHGLSWEPLPDTEPPDGTPRFSCTGLPPGLTFNPDTGEIAGTPTKVGIYNVSSRAMVGRFVSPVVVRRFAIISPHLPLPGVHEALIPADERHPLGAHLSVTAQITGAYTGCLQIGTRRLPFAGKLIQDGESTTSVSATFTIPWGDRGAPVKVAFFADPSNLRLEQVDDQDQILDSVAAAELMHPFFGYLAPTPHVGRHIVGLSLNSSAFGHGFGNVTISPDYHQTFVGQTPEGRGITASSWGRLDENLENVRLCFYATGGTDTAVAGLPRVPTGPQDGPVAVTWIRLPLISSRLAAQGRVEESMDFLTSRTGPARIAQAFPVSQDHQLELRDELSGFSAFLDLRFSSRYTGRFAPLIANPVSIRLDTYLPTGFFTGQFTLRDPNPNNPLVTITRVLPYRGIFLPDHDLALGYFLIPQLPGPDTTMATSPISSGSVRIGNGGKK